MDEVLPEEGGVPGGVERRTRTRSGELRSTRTGVGEQTSIPLGISLDLSRGIWLRAMLREGGDMATG